MPAGDGSTGENTLVTFTCPAVRDGAAGAGGYSIYSGALLPWNSAEAAHCEAR